jgi:hypothetical protein
LFGGENGLGIQLCYAVALLAFVFHTAVCQLFGGGGYVFEVKDGETVKIWHIRLVVIARMAEGVGKVGRYSNVGILVKDGTAQKILQLGAVLGMSIEETMHLATLSLVEIALAIVEEIFFVIVNRYHTASSIFAE